MGICGSTPLRSGYRSIRGRAVGMSFHTFARLDGITFVTGVFRLLLPSFFDFVVTDVYCCCS
jgi:hypothetical protein